MPVSTKSLLLILLLLTGCAKGNQESASLFATKTPTDAAFIEGFLNLWLVERDLTSAGDYFRAGFERPRKAEDLQAWPEELRDLRRTDRALRRPFFPGDKCTLCADLPSCLREGASRKPGTALYSLERFTVAEKHVKELFDLEDLIGEELLMVRFIISGCDLGTVVIFEPKATSKRRIVTLFYVLGEERVKSGE